MKLQKFRKSFGHIANGINYLALALLFAMVVIVAVDVILRKMPGIGANGIKGSNELTTYFMVGVCMLGIPALQIKHGHVWVNLLVNKFPYRFRCYWRFAVMLIETAAVGLLVVGAYNKIMLFYTKSTTTDILNIPKWIFAVLGLIAFIEYFIISLIDTLQLFADGVKNEEPAPGADGWSEDEVKGI